MFIALIVLIACEAGTYEKKTPDEVEELGIVLARKPQETIWLHKRSGWSALRKISNASKVSSISKSLPRKLPFKGPSKDYDPALHSAAKSENDKPILPKSKFNHGDSKSASKADSALDGGKDKASTYPSDSTFASKEAGKAKKSTRDEENQTSGASSKLFDGAKKTMKTIYESSKDEKGYHSEDLESTTLVNPTSEDLKFFRDVTNNHGDPM